MATRGRHIALALVSLAGLPARAEDGLSLPSGMVARLQEVIQNVPGADGFTVRYRFVAAGLIDTTDFDLLTSDLGYLCDSYALPRLSAMGPRPQQIIISLADRELPFGDTDPEAVQFFGAYHIEGGSCEEEAF